MNKHQPGLSRRMFLRGLAGAGGALVANVCLPSPVRAQGPVVVPAEALRPKIPYGVASGDILGNQAVLWSHTDRPARMLIDIATTESMQNARSIVGPAALADTGFSVKYNLDNLPAGQDMFYQIRFQSLEDLNLYSEPVMGRFRTAPAVKRDISFLWSGDTAGQGWGINPAWGGMRIYSTMTDLRPDFFIHSGDTIYADNPLEAEVVLPDGTIWQNVLIEEKIKVAETLSEFRGNYIYNLLDEHVRAFNADVPMIVQWDDHETVNNWYPTEILEDDRYQVKSVALLAARAKRAFLEYNPIRSYGQDQERIFRTIHYGPSLDVFVIDMRSYRAANGANNQVEPGRETDFLGQQQMLWLKQELLASTATWKVIASDMPIGLIVYDNFQTRDTFENLANGDGTPLGRELEVVDLLRFIKYNNITNVVWLTADVHYTAAHYYDPNQAQFTDFNPFYEFVSGPLHAGTFGPNDLDNTFGPQVLFQQVPPEGQVNLPPSAGLQFFGQVRINGQTEVMTVTLRDLVGTALYSVDLPPA